MPRRNKSLKSIVFGGYKRKSKKYILNKYGGGLPELITDFTDSTKQAYHSTKNAIVGDSNEKLMDITKKMDTIEERLQKLENKDVSHAVGGRNRKTKHRKTKHRKTKQRKTKKTKN